MREIIPNMLWVGNFMDGADMAALHQAGVRAVVDLASNEKPIQPARELIYCRFPLLDGGGNSAHALKLAIETVRSLLADEVPTLVFCSAGMSRSVAVTAAAIAAERSVSLEEALSVITEQGAHDVSPALWNEVRMIVDR